MASVKDLFVQCRLDPQFEATRLLKRPLRGPQVEIIKRVEAHVQKHAGGVMTILSARQTGKNEIAAKLQARHLWRRQNSRFVAQWIRTAPTYAPQIVNSKKRLREMLNVNSKDVILNPLFEGRKLIREEGYIWRVGNASVEFISSGPQANVVGATASECLDMDEAHKVKKEKFDEDFAPFTANTNAATLLWGVAADGLDTIEWYRQSNEENGRSDLNLYFPCEVWMEAHPPYREHVENRVNALGWDHPIIKTQYRLISVSAEGRFLTDAHIRNLFDSDHERHLKPRAGTRYEMVIDIAGGNEDFNPENILEGNEETATDSTVIWIYEVTPIVCSNGVFPVIRIVNLKWVTGVELHIQQHEIEETIRYWNPHKVTIDSIGIGRQIGEAMQAKFGKTTINMYTASNQTVSEDCFDLQARLNFSSIKMFENDGSKEWAEFERQCGWTKYLSSRGLMKLEKPKADKHIDMVKALTYIHQNNPIAGMDEIYNVESDYGDT